MIEEIKRCIILAPHTDDGEFGCGGTIAKLIENGCEVFYVAFSAAEKSVPSTSPSDILRKEVVEATQILGIKKSNVIVYDYEVRVFPNLRQEILETMVKLKNDINPQLIFLPSTHDTHQDHKTIAEEGFRAFKQATMLGYEVPWNNLTFTTNGFTVLQEKHLKLKVKSIKCYKSQSFRSYCTEEFIVSLARTRGIQIGEKFAEAFEVIRWIN